MAGIFPKHGLAAGTSNGGIALAVEPATGCDSLYYNEDCPQRVDPRAMNKLIAELVTLINAASSVKYDCGRVDNVLRALGDLYGIPPRPATGNYVLASDKGNLEWRIAPATSGSCTFLTSSTPITGVRYGAVTSAWPAGVSAPQPPPYSALPSSLSAADVAAMQNGNLTTRVINGSMSVGSLWWLGIDLGASYALKSFAIYPPLTGWGSWSSDVAQAASNSGGFGPFYQGALYGSTDGSVWTEIADGHPATSLYPSVAWSRTGLSTAEQCAEFRYYAWAFNIRSDGYDGVDVAEIVLT